MSNNLSLANVINVSVATPQTGVGEYNTSNLAIFTEEAYDTGGFGSLGYKIYLEPTEIADDFGTDSKTYAMALQVFSQQPNILLNGGYLVIFPFVVEVQTITPSAAPSSGTYLINFDGDVTAAVNWDDTATQIQTKVRTLTGLEEATVAGTLATHLTITFKGYYGNAALMTITSNTLNAGITLTVAQVTAGETIDAAITRTSTLVEYFVGMGDVVFGQTDMLAAAAVIEALNKMFLFVSFTAADIAPGGKLDKLATGSFHKSRGLYYGDDLDGALGFMASYAGRAFSTVFTGSNTTQTMHLKTLSGVQPDPTLSQTELNQAIAAGVDTYPSLQGVPKVFCSGANIFFDRIYNLGWLVGALQVAEFNALATTNTKIPQTETGMDVLKGAARNVCEQAVTNQFSAPGSWTSPTTFGNQADLLLNVAQRGYYIYSPPISQQLPADRVARNAPLIQIAIKEAGAIHKAFIVVNVNA